MSQRLLVELWVRSDKGDHPIRAHCRLNQSAQSADLERGGGAHFVRFSGLTTEKELGTRLIRNTLPLGEPAGLHSAKDSLALEKALANGVPLLNGRGYKSHR